MSFAPGIILRGGFSFDDKHLFGPLSLELAAGQWNCLLGPSGVGKSTLLRLLLDLETAGDFVGEITASDGQSLEGRVSYMAQSDLLLPWLNVTQNVILGARLRGQRPDMARADDLIARVGLEDHAVKKPSALSGGMRQRAALARTLMEDRPVVLLDEPFSALDAGTRADMQELAAEVLKDKTVLLVTHDPGEASRLGHHILVLSEAGLRAWPCPETPPVRTTNDPLMLQCQADLLAHLRGMR